MKRRPFLDRFASRKQPRHVVLGIAWYLNECTWSEMKAFAQVPERFENSHAEWERMASETLASIVRRGSRCVKVPMEPDEFRQWMNIQREENNASARATFVS
jgi:hypothetical protein